jgi:hypothetical protein
MNIVNGLPKNLEKTISNLARAREKSAKQKYLLDLGESLVMHLCSFVLGEYKAAEAVSVNLEKSFLNNSKSLGFGVYLGWLREASVFLQLQQCPSEIHALLHGAHDFQELSKFIKAYEALKGEVNRESEEYQQVITTTLKNNLAKVNFLEFFTKVVELRNRVAHPHKEVKGKMVSWPFSEAYFDAINPYLEAALNKTISELNKIWEFRQYIVDSNEEGKLILLSEESGEFTELENARDFQEGVRVVANDANTVLLSDWKWLLRAGEEALAKIKQEEEDLRNKATVEDLKESIKAALNDQQISLDEMNFFESIGKTRMGLSKEQVKALIISVAKEMNIEDPFPEVDKRFIEVVDNAINTRTYNEFLLKLTGQQYGVDSETFDQVFLERTFALNVDPEEIRKNKVLQFSMEELTAFQGLMSAHKWLMGMFVFRKYTKESIFKIKEDSYQFGTKEYWHRTAFSSLEHFVKTRLEKLVIDQDVEWDTKQNNWQIGVMTSYAWCTLYPKNLPSKKILALHFSLYASGDAAIGYLPDWKDYKDLANYGLLLNVFSEHLKAFAKAYAEDLRKHPNLVLWDSLNNHTKYSFTESISRFPWFYDYLYGFDQIQFYHKVEDIIANPSILIDSFDISFNLFQGLFEAVNRDYLNLLDKQYLINDHEQTIREHLVKLEPLLADFGLCDPVDEDPEKNAALENEAIDEGIEEVPASDGLKGSVHLGYFAREFRPKVKGYPMALSFQIKQDYLNNQFNFLIYISCAGYLQADTHLPVERVLESMVDLAFENTSFYFKRSKFLAVMPIDDINSFNPVLLTQYFLDAFATRCAQASVKFNGLKISSPLIKMLLPSINESLDQRAIELPALVGDAIKKERNWVRGARYLDYINGARNSGTWLGWGLEWKKNQLFAGIILHLSDSVKGASIHKAMESKAQEYSHWKLVETGAAEIVDSEWILSTGNGFKFTASTEHSKPHTAAHGLITNQKTYWAAKVKNDEQWWQLESPTPMIFSGMKLTGSPQGNSFMEEFTLSYSVDGIDWNSLSSMRGVKDGFEIKEILFDEPYTARFVKVQPKKFTGWPGFRVDFLAKKVMPSKIELQWLIPVSSTQDLGSVMSQVASKINEVKGIQGVGI